MQLLTLNDLLHWAEREFINAELFFGHGTDNAWDEAVALARHVLDLPIDADRSLLQISLSIGEKERFIELVNTRINKRIPVPYLTQEAWFAGLKFYVDERVIIPRSPMAELIIDGFQPWLGQRPVKRILDLCTGSACMAIACAYAFEDAHIDAIDISPDVLAVAHKNVALHHCEQRVRLIQSDLFSACAENSYDIIISNPPYVSAKEMSCLPKEYEFEPTLALAAGADGLACVKRLLTEAPRYLANQGLLFVEVGNAATVEKEYPSLPFTWITFERGGDGVFLLTVEDQTWQSF